MKNKRLETEKRQDVMFNEPGSQLPWMSDDSEIKVLNFTLTLYKLRLSAGQRDLRRIRNRNL